MTESERCQTAEERARLVVQDVRNETLQLIVCEINKLRIHDYLHDYKVCRALTRLEGRIMQLANRDR